MDYTLDSLGSRNFEHMSLALLVKAIGPKLTVFGDGPDGGREATWRGPAHSLGEFESWDGYGVVQAKFKLHTEDPSRNLTWLKSAVRSELIEWARPESKRSEKPDFIVFVTNVRLSSVPGAGKDEILDYAFEIKKELGLQTKDFRFWDYYDLNARLDGDESVRKRYAAFVTPGDLIATLLDAASGFDETFGQAIAAYTARTLKDESLLNLTQAGSAGDGQTTIADVFVDLPANVPPQSWPNDGGEVLFFDHVRKDDDEETREDSDDEDETRPGIANHLINVFNYLPSSKRDGSSDPHKVVLVGGPGQGKSTITQWLAQLYRAQFLEGSPLAATAEVSAAIERLAARQLRLALPELRARRWPIRIVLTELADFLAANPDSSLLHYMAVKISERSSFDVDSLMLRKWMGKYPWILLIDGLDEVPATSNRNQVMGSIHDFFIDVAVIGGDVATVATTRPQGYSEEFSKKEYQHFILKPLQVEEALAYAEGLVSARLGAGTPSAAKVLERLKRASREEHTRRLFESPLQVTILEVLLERLGKPPSDRSRLYSAYFEVISQREQEKSGALSDLLQRYESDVNYLHRAVGFELQRRGSEVGETSASLSEDEFHRLIVKRFVDQGHGASEAEDLSESFSTLVTDRLVFLAKVQADRIGFELRSFQEFMSGEHIVNLPEQEVIPAIHKLATIPYWRNVVLFAVGSIFAHKEHLRAEVVLMCDELNTGYSSAPLLLKGSELALDILRDGSCVSMPKYAQHLAANALRQVEVPHSSELQKLVYLRSPDFSDMLWDTVESSTSATKTVWLNRAKLASYLYSYDSSRAKSAMQSLWVGADSEFRSRLVTLAWDTRDWALGEVIAEDFALVSPRYFLMNRALHRRRQPTRRDATQPDWMKFLNELEGDPALRDLDQVEGEPFYALCTPLGENQEAWKWLATVESADLEWAALRSLATYCLEPSASSLAEVLVAISSAKLDILPEVTPWPVIACIRHALKFDGFSSKVAWADLPRSADELLSGRLGDVADWRAAQSRWGAMIPVTTEFVEQCVQPGRWPLRPTIGTEGFLPDAYSYTSFDISTDESRAKTIDLITVMGSKIKENSVWRGLVAFLASLLVDDDEVDRPRDMSETFESVAKHVTKNTAGGWITWLALVPMTESQPSRNVLRITGSQEHLVGRLPGDRAEQLANRAEVGDIGLLRLAFSSRPLLASSISSERLQLIAAGSHPRMLGAMHHTVCLFEVDTASLWRGAADEHFHAIARLDSESLGRNWFLRALESAAIGAAEIASRGGLVLAETDPSLAEQCLQAARIHTRTNSVSIEAEF